MVEYGFWKTGLGLDGFSLTGGLCIVIGTQTSIISVMIIDSL